MITHPEQRQRLYAKLCRELGPSTLAALADPDVTEVMCNPDGALWIESQRAGHARDRRPPYGGPGREPHRDSRRAARHGGAPPRGRSSRGSSR